MGLIMSIDFYRDGSNPEHQKKVAALDACLEAGVEPPVAIMEYFEGYDEMNPLLIPFKPRRIDDENMDGFEIDIDEIPEETKTIRFYRS